MPDLNALQLQALEIWATVLAWLQSPTFYAQIGAIFAAWILAGFVSKLVRKRVPLLRDEPAEGKLLLVRSWIFKARSLLFPILLVAILAASVSILRSVTGSVCGAGVEPALLV